MASRDAEAVRKGREIRNQMKEDRARYFEELGNLKDNQR